MVGLYALLSKIRMTSSANVVESAEAVIRTILRTNSCPNKSSPELQDLILKRKFVDPLLDFSEVCRDELRDLPSRGHTPAPVQERPSSGRQGALLRRTPIS